MNNLEKIKKEFYLKDTLTVAKNLVGQYLVREINNKKIIMEITETEAYIGSIDKACHAYNGRKTERTKVLYEDGGTIYIYLIYGMYYCLNIVTESKGTAAAVLIRGAVPINEIYEVYKLRYGENIKKEDLTKYKIKNLANGPGKLCKALCIDKSFNNKSILDSKEIYVLKNPDFKFETIKSGKRINIDYAEEAKDFLWRFYI